MKVIDAAFSRPVRLTMFPPFPGDFIHNRKYQPNYAAGPGSILKKVEAGISIPSIIITIVAIMSITSG